MYNHPPKVHDGGHTLSLPPPPHDATSPRGARSTGIWAKPAAAQGHSMWHLGHARYRLERTDFFCDVLTSTDVRTFQMHNGNGRLSDYRNCITRFDRGGVLVPRRHLSRGRGYIYASRNRLGNVYTITVRNKNVLRASHQRRILAQHTCDRESLNESRNAYQTSSRPGG